MWPLCVRELRRTSHGLTATCPNSPPDLHTRTTTWWNGKSGSAPHPCLGLLSAPTLSSAQQPAEKPWGKHPTFVHTTKTAHILENGKECFGSPVVEQTTPEEDLDRLGFECWILAEQWMHSVGNCFSQHACSNQNSTQGKKTHCTTTSASPTQSCLVIFSMSQLHLNPIAPH